MFKQVFWPAAPRDQLHTNPRSASGLAKPISSAMLLQGLGCVRGWSGCYWALFLFVTVLFLTSFYLVVSPLCPVLQMKFTLRSWRVRLSARSWTWPWMTWPHCRAPPLPVLSTPYFLSELFFTCLLLYADTSGCSTEEDSIMFFMRSLCSVFYGNSIAQ